MVKTQEPVKEGYNFGVTNYHGNALELIHLNSKIQMKVVIDKQYVFNEESGFGIYHGENEKGERLKLSGIFPSPLRLGLTYDIKGKVVEFRNEKQVSVETAKPTRPVTKYGIVEYLKNLDGLYRKSEYLVEMYGEEILDIIIQNPQKLIQEHPEIEEECVAKWKEQIENLLDNQEQLNQLMDWGLNLRQAKKLYEKYKDGVIEKIQENPYLLVSEFSSFGFEKADEIAKNIGYDPRGIYRIQEGLKYVLHQASKEGHCYLLYSELLERAVSILEVRLTEQEMNHLLEEYKGKQMISYRIGEYVFPIAYALLSKQYLQYRLETNPFKKEQKRLVVTRITKSEIQKEVDSMIQQNQLIQEYQRIYLPEFYEAECRIAQKALLLCRNAKENFKDVEADLNQYLTEKGIVLEEKQKEAVLTFTKGEGGLFILNGSAGCGKTFSLKIILRMLELQYLKMNRKMEVKIFAPTGKASKVVQKSTGRLSTTLHRGLKYKPSIGFEHNANHPIDADVVVVDESTMMDVLLADSLLSAIDNGTKVILLGDTKQLASVGAGNVFQDLIDSGIIPIVTLNVVKRQGVDSGIHRNANRIIRGEMITSCKDTKDAYVLRKNTLLDTQLAIIKSVYEVQRVYGFDISDIQVLCPQKNGLIGTNAMNYLIQQEFNYKDKGIYVLNKKVRILNPINKKEEIVPLNFQIGDKVIHIKNNYDMKWYRKVQGELYIENFDVVGITNGETGIIIDIKNGTPGDTYKHRIIVQYEEGYVFYDDQFDELDHAYALTIHKSQGSQWKAVIMPIVMENYSMLDNNLLYTGYTRAELFHCTIGQPEAMEYAIRTQKIKNRNTTLKQRLIEYSMQNHDMMI